VTLIRKEDLQSAHAQYEQGQAANVPPAKIAFVYKTRVTAPVYKNKSAVPVAVPVVTVAKAVVTPVVNVTATVKAEPEEIDYGALRRKGEKALCLACGHERGEHHLHPEGHYQDGEWLFYCLTAHCTARFWQDQQSHECHCLHFRGSPEDVPELTKPAVEDWTLCVACAHPRLWHCTKRKAGATLTHEKWLGLEIDGAPIPCQHTPEGGALYACSSPSCAWRIGTGEDEHYCTCDKFLSPFLKKRTPAKASAKAIAPRISRAELAHKARVLVEVVTENSSLTVKELADASGRSPSWVRNTLKKVGIVLGKSHRSE
jgi:hypothetical protein